MTLQGSEGHLCRKAVQGWCEAGGVDEEARTGARHMGRGGRPISETGHARAVALLDHV